MKINPKQIITAILLLVLSSLTFGCTTKHNLACYKEHCFEVEIADSEAERALGLMYREYLARDKGMLFIFEQEGVWNFWMKNTLIPLDIIWINKEQEIVFIAKNVPPCKQEPCPYYSNDIPALYVLEINSGLADKLNMKIGEKVELRLV